MEITSLKISQEKDKLELVLANAENANELRFWNNSTYKNFLEAVDLSDKLSSGVAVQNIEITLNEINESSFDGIYFIEVESPDEVAIEYTYNIDKYKECIIDMISTLTACDDCLKKTNDKIDKAQLLYDSLTYALELRLIDEMILILNTLSKFCSNKCRTCGPQTKAVSNENKENLNPDTLDVSVDGGNI